MPASGQSFDFDTFKKAFQSQDVETWITFYAPNAEWVEYRHTNPPHAPNRVVGQPEIKAVPGRVKASNISIVITDEILGPTRAAFCDTCTLSDGARRIIEHVIIHYSNGRIIRQVDVEAWD